MLCDYYIIWLSNIARHVMCFKHSNIKFNHSTENSSTEFFRGADFFTIYLALPRCTETYEEHFLCLKLLFSRSISSCVELRLFLLHLYCVIGEFYKFFSPGMSHIFYEVSASFEVTTVKG